MATLFTNSGNLYNRKMSQDASPETEEERQENKIYIDERNLAQNDFFLNNVNEKAPKFDTVYEINGEIFREENYNDNELYLRFDVQLNHCHDGATSVEETETDIYLEILSIQNIEEGIIINSYIFITINQWNTLIVDENYKYCFVCDDFIESLKHIEMVTHVKNLQRSRPLKKFDLAITRSNGENYHCAVCNVVFNKNNDKDHFDSESHNDKMEHARNQTLELTESNGNDYESSEDSDLSNDTDLSNGTNENNDNSISYASMVKKPNPTPKYITYTVGDRTYNISFDHWHMIVYPQINQFYCMTCKAYGHLSTKTAHCLNISHTEKLSQCYFVEKYHRFLLRRMFLDFKFYHCGICNKVIFTSEVDDHIINVHDKKYKSNSNISETENYNNNQNIVDWRNINNDCSRNWNNDIPINQNNYESNKFERPIFYQTYMCRELLEINNTSPGLYNDFILYQFFCMFRLSFAAYNIILRTSQGFFCGICNVIANEEAMKYHMINYNHVARLRFIPFEAYFGLNLIRTVNNRAHCTICNTLIDNLLQILSHITSKSHRALLNQALKVPDIPTPVNHEESINQNGQIDSNQVKDQPKMNNQQVNKIESSEHLESQDDSTENQNEQIESNQVKDQPKMNNQQVNKIESNEHFESHDDSTESIENYEHEFLYLRFKNKNIKVTFNSYHSLLTIGDGTKYCFVCSRIIIECSKKHIESSAHIIELKKCKFLDKYDKHLLRQIYLHYHCCTCNMIFSKKYLTKHLSRSIQEDKTSKKIRKCDLNAGIKFLQVETQKEEIYLNMQESKMKIVARIEIKPKSNHVEIKKTNKIIIVDSNVLKVSWDSWQGILNKKSGYFCILCDKDLKNFELNYHISEEWHANALKNTFDKKYFPNLIRKVTDTSVHCLTCNQVMPNYFISDHMNGKKHILTYNSIRDYSSSVTTYSDCNDNVLYISN